MLKGKSRPVTAYRLDVRRSGRDGDPAPARLAARRPRPGARAAAKRVRRGRGRRGAGGQVTIVGEPGIGKSRLARAFTTGDRARRDRSRRTLPALRRRHHVLAAARAAAQAGRDETVLDGLEPRDLRRRRARSSRSLRPSGRSSWSSTTCTGPSRPSSTSSSTWRAGSATRRSLLLCLTRPQLLERRPGWASASAATLMLRAALRRRLGGDCSRRSGARRRSGRESPRRPRETRSSSSSWRRSPTRTALPGDMPARSAACSTSASTASTARSGRRSSARRSRAGASRSRPCST